MFIFLYAHFEFDGSNAYKKQKSWGTGLITHDASSLLLTALCRHLGTGAIICYSFESESFYALLLKVQFWAYQ